MTNWEKLIVRYADGRPLCNCRQAYYTTGGKYWLGGQEHNDGLYCGGGCGAARLDAQDIVAAGVVRDLPTSTPRRE